MVLGGWGFVGLNRGELPAKKIGKCAFFSSFFFINIVCNLHHLFSCPFFSPDCCYCIYIIANENGSGGIHSLDTQDSNGLASSRWAVVFRSCRV